MASAIKCELLTEGDTKFGYSEGRYAPALKKIVAAKKIELLPHVYDTRTLASGYPAPRRRAKLRKHRSQKNAAYNSS